MEDGELPARVLFCTAHMQQLETTGAVTGNIDDLVTAADVRQRTVDHFANIIRKAACRHDPREACDCTILPTAWTGDRIDSIDAKPETIAALLVDAMIERVTQHRP